MRSESIFIAFCLVVIMVACGYDSSPDYTTAPAPVTPAPTGSGSGSGSDPAPAGSGSGSGSPAPQASAWDTIKPLVAAKCGKCHNGTIQPLDFSKEAVFRGSAAAKRISAGTMPPSGPLDNDSKTKLLAFLSSAS